MRMLDKYPQLREALSNSDQINIYREKSSKDYFRSLLEGQDDLLMDIFYDLNVHLLYELWLEHGNTGHQLMMYKND